MAKAFVNRSILFFFVLLSSLSAVAQTPVDDAVEPTEVSTEAPVFKLKDELEQSGEAKSSGDIGSMVVGLSAVLGIIFALAWLSKRFNLAAPGGNSNMRMISAMSVGQKEKIILVEVEGEKLLLGVTPQQISPLKEFGKVSSTDQGMVETAVTKTDFSERMSRLLKAGVSGHE